MEALDAKFAKREKEKKRRKEDKFRSKLYQLKKKTRVEAYRRSQQAGAGGGMLVTILAVAGSVHMFGAGWWRMAKRPG